MGELITSTKMKGLGIIIGIFLVGLSIVSSIIFGLTEISLQMVIDSYFHFDGSNEHIIIQDTRIPRAFIAAAVGASLAISGALLQGVTQNPLASPSLFGINAGAGFFIVLSVLLLGASSLTVFTWVAFLGAAFSAAIVYTLGSIGKGGVSPIKLTLAGAAMAAFFSSLTQGILSIHEKALDEVLYWLAGSIAGRKLEILLHVLPYLCIGWILALLIGSKMNVLTMGEDVAKGLGQRTTRVKLMAILIVILLAGGSVAIAGPIAFVGIVVPHLARKIVGIDYRWLIPYCAILGAILLLVADIGARYIIMPNEVPVGIMTVLIGTPFFIYIARKGISR